MWTPTSSATRSCRAVRQPHAEPRLRARLRETHARGFALNPGLIVAGSFGIGAAVFTSSGHPQWALSLTGVEFRSRRSAFPSSGAPPRARAPAVHARRRLRPLRITPPRVPARQRRRGRAVRRRPRSTPPCNG
jgi:DNA-binding IclR family transcriptional regulator